ASEDLCVTDPLPQMASARRFGFRFWWMYVVPVATMSLVDESRCALCERDHLFRRRRTGWVVGQAPRRHDAPKRLPFDRDVEVAGSQPADIGHQPTLRAGHLLRRRDLDGRAEQTVELSDRVAGYLVVQ